MLDAIFIQFVSTICFMLMTVHIAPSPMALTAPTRKPAVCCCVVAAAAYTNRGGRPGLPNCGFKQLTDVCEKYSIENEITYNAIKTLYVYLAKGYVPYWPS